MYRNITLTEAILLYLLLLLYLIEYFYIVNKIQSSKQVKIRSESTFKQRQLFSLYHIKSFHYIKSGNIIPKSAHCQSPAHWQRDTSKPWSVDRVLHCPSEPRPVRINQPALVFLVSWSRIHPAIAGKSQMGFLGNPSVGSGVDPGRQG